MTSSAPRSATAGRRARRRRAGCGWRRRTPARRRRAGRKSLSPSRGRRSTTPRRGRSSTAAASSISPTGENTRTRSPSPMPERRRVVGVDQHFVPLARRMQAGQLVEPGVHRVPVAPVRQLERVAVRRLRDAVRRAVRGARRRTPAGRRAPSCRRFAARPGNARTRAAPAPGRADWPSASRHLTLRPLTFRPVAISSRSIQCGVNSRPGLRVSRASARVALMKPLIPFAPNSGLRIAMARSTKIRHSSRAPGGGSTASPPVLHDTARRACCS